MSYNAGTLVTCPNLQGRLEEYWAVPNPAEITIPSPLLQFMLTDANRGGLQQAIAPGNGKVRTVTVTYKQRRRGSQVSVNQPNPVCTASNKNEQFFENYTIDVTQNVQDNLLVDPADSRYACEAGERLMMEDISMMLNAIEERVAQKNAEQAIALRGEWGDRVLNVDAFGQLEVRTQLPTLTYAPYPNTMQEIDTAAIQTAYNQPKAIFGGRILYDYANRALSGCCADYGLDIADMFNRFKTVVSYDDWVMAALGGQDKNLMMQMGALQLLHWNAFEGSEGFNQFTNPLYSQQVVYTKSGVPVDLMMKVDCGKIHIVGTATTKTVGLPRDMFPVGDQFDGVTWVNRIEVVNS